MEITAITVCVNYDDILKFMLQKNAKLLKVWYIVTTKEDKGTISLINKANLPNVHLLFYDGFYTNAKFNKGGAIKYAQKYVLENNNTCNILLLDADISLPDNLLDLLPNTLEQDVLYGVSERLDYMTLKHFMDKTSPRKYAQGGNFAGFFQLYKQAPKYLYADSYNCSATDIAFRDLFPKKINLNTSLAHLGGPSINWNGRVSGIFT